MRSLSLSLLLVIMVAIFGVGLTLDTTFERYSSKPRDSVTQISAFGLGVAGVINRAESPEVAVSHWQAYGGYSLELSDKKNLPLPESLQAAFEVGEPLILGSEQGLSIHYFLPQHGNVLTVHNDHWPTESNDELAWVFTALFYLGTLAAVMLWLKPLLKRIDRLRHATKAFGAGDLKSRITLQGVNYIQDIEQEFNRMADQIQQLIEDNKLLTSAVSHDLRTPIARLRFGIDTLMEQPSSSKDSQYLHRINSDLTEMESLLNSHLEFARLDNVMGGMDKELVNLRGLLDECVAQFYDDEIVVEMHADGLTTDDAFTVVGCIEHLATLFNNLLRNAVKYANTSVQVDMCITQKMLEIIICDDGPGIPASQREHVMKPFERGDESRDKGYGLGLAVAARIAKHHGAEIIIDSCTASGGAKIRVQWAMTDIY